MKNGSKPVELTLSVQLNRILSEHSPEVSDAISSTSRKIDALIALYTQQTNSELGVVDSVDLRAAGEARLGFTDKLDVKTLDRLDDFLANQYLECVVSCSFNPEVIETTRGVVRRYLRQDLSLLFDQQLLEQADEACHCVTKDTFEALLFQAVESALVCESACEELLGLIDCSGEESGLRFYRECGELNRYVDKWLLKMCRLLYGESPLVEYNSRLRAHFILQIICTHYRDQVSPNLLDFINIIQQKSYRLVCELYYLEAPKPLKSWEKFDKSHPLASDPDFILKAVNKLGGWVLQYVNRATLRDIPFALEVMEAMKYRMFSKDCWEYDDICRHFETEVKGEPDKIVEFHLALFKGAIDNIDNIDPSYWSSIFNTVMVCLLKHSRVTELTRSISSFDSDSNHNFSRACNGGNLLQFLRVLSDVRLSEELTQEQQSNLSSLGDELCQRYGNMASPPLFAYNI